MEHDHLLWTRLNEYELDAIDSEFPFSKRLARENSWTLDYAKRVINEYIRFVFLAMTSNHPVTPSDEIDQVWHLHLIYTKAYWEEFCKDIIRTSFHHHPTKGGKKEGEKFRNWYAKTKQAYIEAFGVAPPIDIWKNERERFEFAPHYKRINTAANWIIPKPNALKRINMVAGVVLVMAFSAVRCAGDTIQIGDYRLGLMIGFIFLMVIFGSILFALNNRTNDQKSKGNTSSTGCGGDFTSSEDADSGSNNSGSGDDGGSGCSGCSGCGGCGS
jgi:hypothetical protein